LLEIAAVAVVAVTANCGILLTCDELAAALVKMGALRVEIVEGYAVAKLDTMDVKLVNALAAVWFAITLFARAARVEEAAEGLSATIWVAMLAGVTPAGAEPAKKPFVAAVTAAANCALVAAVSPAGTGEYRDTPVGRNPFTYASSLYVAPVIPLPGGFV
jgi:hypothetical protein